MHFYTECFFRCRGKVPQAAGVVLSMAFKRGLKLWCCAHRMATDMVGLRSLCSSSLFVAAAGVSTNRLSSDLQVTRSRQQWLSGRWHTGARKWERLDSGNGTKLCSSSKIGSAVWRCFSLTFIIENLIEMKGVLGGNERL